MSTIVKLCETCLPQTAGVEQLSKYFGKDECHLCHRMDDVIGYSWDALRAGASRGNMPSAAVVALAGIGIRGAIPTCATCRGAHIFKLTTCGPPWGGVLHSPSEYVAHFSAIRGAPVPLEEARSHFACSREKLAPAADARSDEQRAHNFACRTVGDIERCLHTAQNNGALERFEAAVVVLEGAFEQVRRAERGKRLPTGNYSAAEVEQHLAGKIDLALERRYWMAIGNPTTRPGDLKVFEARDPRDPRPGVFRDWVIDELQPGEEPKPFKVFDPGPNPHDESVITDEQAAEIWRAVAVDYGIPLDILMGGSGNSVVALASRAEFEAQPVQRLVVSRATIGAGKEVPVITSQEDADRVFGKGQMDFDRVTRGLRSSPPTTVFRYEPDSEDGR